MKQQGQEIKLTRISLNLWNPTITSKEKANYKLFLKFALKRFLKARKIFALITSKRMPIANMEQHLKARFSASLHFDYHLILT